MYAHIKEGMFLVSRRLQTWW